MTLNSLSDCINRSKLGRLRVKRLKWTSLPVHCENASRTFARTPVGKLRRVHLSTKHHHNTSWFKDIGTSKIMKKVKLRESFWLLSNGKHFFLYIWRNCPNTLCICCALNKQQEQMFIIMSSFINATTRPPVTLVYYWSPNQAHDTQSVTCKHNHSGFICCCV